MLCSLIDNTILFHICPKRKVYVSNQHMEEQKDLYLFLFIFFGIRMH